MKKEYLYGCGIDYDRGVENFMGEAELYHTLLRNFLTENTFFTAKRCFEREDHDGAEKAVHAMKSTTGTLCMTKLYRCCFEVVEALRGEDYDRAARLFDETYALYETVARGIFDCFEEDDIIRDVLIVIDMQNDFLTGPLGTPGARAIVEDTVKLIESAKKRGFMIFATMDTHDENYLETLEGRKIPEHCIKGTEGWELEPRIKEALGEEAEIFEKDTFACFGLADRLKRIAKKVGDVYICGVTTDICVLSNALLLRSTLPNTEIIVRTDCCATGNYFDHDSAKVMMRKCLIEAWDKDYSYIQNGPAKKRPFRPMEGAIDLDTLLATPDYDDGLPPEDIGPLPGADPDDPLKLKKR